jgi:hypothetical protein
MQQIAFVIVALSGLWLTGVSVLMALRPLHCIRSLKWMADELSGSNWRLALAEQGLRLLAGAGLFLRSPSSKLPLFFEVAGWVIVATSVLIIALPMQWHAAYAVWWGERLTAGTFRALAPISAVTGLGLIYLAL